MRLLIMGPPGAGKGTQAKGIAEYFRIPAISTGAIFRSVVASGSELGREVGKLLDAGRYVADDLTESIVFERLGRPDCVDGWLLDGFPRTVHQVHALDEFNHRHDVTLDAVLALVADVDELVARMLQRARIEGRSDDNEATIRHRFDVYREQTKPLLDIYRERGLLLEVDGIGEIDEVAQRIRTRLDAFLDAEEV